MRSDLTALMVPHSSAGRKCLGGSGTSIKPVSSVGEVPKTKVVPPLLKSDGLTDITHAMFTQHGSSWCSISLPVIEATRALVFIQRSSICYGPSSAALSLSWASAAASIMARQLASMTLSETPIVVQFLRWSDHSTRTRTLAAVPRLGSSTRTL